MYRDHTKAVRIGNRVIGGGNPILIQSMTNTPTEDVAATVEQIHRLEAVGCEIVRVTVPNIEAARAVGEIKKQISIPHWNCVLPHTAAHSPTGTALYTISLLITRFFHSTQ